MDIRKFGRPAAAVLILLASFAGSCRSCREEHKHKQIAENIPVMKAYELIQSNQDNSDFVILDMRTAPEYRTGHIESAVNIDFHGRDFRQKLDVLDREKTYLIYCRTAGRTGSALRIMKDMGFSRVYNMSGGITDWIRRELPIVK